MRGDGKRQISADVFVVNAQEAACMFGVQVHGLEKRPLEDWTTIVTDQSGRKSKKFETPPITK